MKIGSISRKAAVTAALVAAMAGATVAASPHLDVIHRDVFTGAYHLVLDDAPRGVVTQHVAAVCGWPESTARRFVAAASGSGVVELFVCVTGANNRFQVLLSD